MGLRSGWRFWTCITVLWYVTWSKLNMAFPYWVMVINSWIGNLISIIRIILNMGMDDHKLYIHIYIYMYIYIYIHLYTMYTPCSDRGTYVCVGLKLTFWVQGFCSVPLGSRLRHGHPERFSQKKRHFDPAGLGQSWLENVGHYTAW